MRLSERYGPHRHQRARLDVPAGPGPFPVAVLVHGGFWRAAYTWRLERALAADLVARGWAAWTIEYRRLGRRSGGGWPHTFADVGAAVAHLRALDDVRLDHTRVVAIGHSAGGHLAAWLATGEQPQVDGFVAQAGVLDLHEAARQRLSGGVVHELMGGTPDAVPERYGAASPIARLPLRVPGLAVHGGRDDVVPPSFSRAFAAASGCDHVEIAGEGHMEHLDPRSQVWAETAAWLQERFADRPLAATTV